MPKGNTAILFYIMNQKSDENIEIAMLEVNVSPLDQSDSTYRNDDNGSEIWNWCISNQFPISEIISKSENMVILSTGDPHQGYTIHTQMKDGKYDGDATIQSPENVIIAKFKYSEGNMTGPCRLYYPSGILFFKGYLENGYRQGRGTEYNEQGIVIFDGFYEKGVKLKIYPFKELGEGYWKEMDDENELRSVYQIDDKGKRYGICYFFEHGKISRVSEWQDGNEIDVLKEFTADNTMIEYENGVKVYEGGFLNSLDENYPRNGSGTEYDTDGKSILFKGMYKDNVRNGMGMSYKNGKPCSSEKEKWIMGRSLKNRLMIQLLKIVILLVVLIICLMINYYFGLIISILMILYLCFPSECANRCGSKKCVIIDDEIITKVVSTNNANNNNNNNNKNDESFKSRMMRMGNTLLKYINELTIIFILIILIIGTIDYFIAGPHVNIITSSYYAPPGIGNHFLYFEISNHPFLRYITISSGCFAKVKKFKIKRMKSLQTIEIGFISFTQEKYGSNNDKSKSFHILNCESLKSIKIGDYGFNDFGGKFELKNLPQLLSIQIGTIGSKSYNFYGSSFVIRGIELILNI